MTREQNKTFGNFVKALSKCLTEDQINFLANNTCESMSTLDGYCVTHKCDQCIIEARRKSAIKALSVEQEEDAANMFITAKIIVTQAKKTRYIIKSGTRYLVNDCGWRWATEYEMRSLANNGLWKIFTFESLEQTKLMGSLIVPENILWDIVEF